MKQPYEKAAAEVITFTNGDIVTFSNCGGSNVGWGSTNEEIGKVIIEE